jgi:hypothetical protein
MSIALDSAVCRAGEQVPSGGFFFVRAVFSIVLVKLFA